MKTMSFIEIFTLSKVTDWRHVPCYKLIKGKSL